MSSEQRQYNAQDFGSGGRRVPGRLVLLLISVNVVEYDQGGGEGGHVASLDDLGLDYWNWTIRCFSQSHQCQRGGVRSRW